MTACSRLTEVIGITTWQSGLRPSVNRSPSSGTRCPSFIPLRTWSHAIDANLRRSAQGTIAGPLRERGPGAKLACERVILAGHGGRCKELLEREILRVWQ